MTITPEIWLILILLAAVLVLLVILLVKQGAMAGKLTVDVDQEIDALSESMARLGGQFDADRKMNAEFNAQLRDSLETNLRQGMKTQFQAVQDLSEKQLGKLSEMTEAQERSLRYLVQENAQQKEELKEASGQLKSELLAESVRQREAITRLLTESLLTMQTSNEQKIESMQSAMKDSLDKIQGVVGEKLDKTLNERLDQNFRTVGEQLGNLYKSLGELHDLSSGVQDLNKTLTNVKTRGTFGEVQLERILEQTLTPSQYEKNVATKKNSADRVEFAVKIPGLAEKETIYLPIDAKFPSDLYNAIVDAADTGDAAALTKATGDLRRRILDEARTIRDKYLDPPLTTNYAILFLPTEGLYAEVLRIDGLTEQCQKSGVIVTGPTTITAVLNSLQVSFRNVALSKKSVEVMRLLEAIKAQFARMDAEVEKTRKKLSEAAQATDALQHRTQLIQNRMKKIGEVDIETADRLLLDGPPDTFGADDGGV